MDILQKQTSEIELIAHIRYGSGGKPEVQTVAEHCRNTACYAKKCLVDVGLGTAGYLAGLLHDMGKAKVEFAEYIKSGDGSCGSVNHTFAGCRMVLEQFHGEYAHADEDLTAELIAFAIGSHHGLFDCVDENETSGSLHRMRKADIGYEETRDNFMRYQERDSLRFYYLGNKYQTKIEHYGTKQTYEAEDVLII